MTHEEIATKAATEAVAKMREFHQDDLKSLREYIDTRSDSLERTMNNRFDRVKV